MLRQSAVLYASSGPGINRHPAIPMVALISFVVLLSGCPATTLLSVKFDADAIGSPPATTQAVGTVSLDEGAGSIRVVNTPAPAVTATKWVRISHPTSPTPQTSMRAQMGAPAGDGSITLTTALYIPAGTGAVTVQLEPFSMSEDSYFNFIHVDLMPDGSLRINDGPTTFGHFPHDQVFLLVATLNASSTAATVRVALAGSGTSGSQDVPISASLLGFARQFGAVRIWMGFQHRGQFYADDVLVLKRAS
jgi:hypothetical protein